MKSLSKLGRRQDRARSISLMLTSSLTPSGAQMLVVLPQVPNSRTRPP